jgi:hypothetical protein
LTEDTYTEYLFYPGRVSSDLHITLNYVGWVVLDERAPGEVTRAVHVVNVFDQQERETYAAVFAAIPYGDVCECELQEALHAYLDWLQDPQNMAQFNDGIPLNEENIFKLV